MANTIKTVMTYPLEGQVDFPITFEYLARKFIRVTLIGKDRKVLSLNNDYRFSTKTQITTNKAWSAADGYQYIEIRRFTSATERLVDFADGSILRAYDMNLAQLQAIHISEEARDLTADTIGVNNDGDLDARGRRIVNVANPTSGLDAVNLQTVRQWDNSALNSANKAKSEANRAWEEAERAKWEAGHASTSANAAWEDANRAKNEADISTANAQQTKAHKDAAAKSENNAFGSAQTAAEQTNLATISANNSANSEREAKKQADRAKTEADKLGNWNALAGAVDKVAGSEVLWKYKLRTPYIDIHNKLNIGFRKSEGANYEPNLMFHFDSKTYCGKFSAKADGSIVFEGSKLKIDCDTITGNLWSSHINAKTGYTMTSGKFWNHAGDYFVCDKPVQLDNTFNQVPVVNIRNGDGNTSQCVYTYLAINRGTQELSYDIAVNNTQSSALYRLTQSGLHVNKNIVIEQGEYLARFHDNGNITCNSKGVWEGGNLAAHINGIKDSLTNEINNNVTNKLNKALVDLHLGGKQTYTVTSTTRDLDLSSGQVMTGIAWNMDGSRWAPARIYFREVIATRGDGSWYVIKSQ